MNFIDSLTTIGAVRLNEVDLIVLSISKLVSTFVTYYIGVSGLGMIDTIASYKIAYTLFYLLSLK